MWWVELAANEIVRAFGALAECIGSPVIFHCNQGANRTGIVAALLLDALGVDEDSIVADYALTAVVDPELMPDVAVDSEALRGLLAHLSSEFGGASECLLAQGLAPSAMQRIHERLVVPHP
jgi:hypothetical protein